MGGGVRDIACTLAFVLPEQTWGTKGLIRLEIASLLASQLVCSAGQDMTLMRPGSWGWTQGTLSAPEFAFFTQPATRQVTATSYQSQQSLD